MKSKNKKAVLLIVDSLDWRWVNQKTMPFLSKFLEKNQKAKLNTLLGFSSSIYSCLWPSLYPKDHNEWCHFRKKKEVKRVNSFLRFLYKITPEFISIPLRFYYNKITHNEPGIAIFPPLEELHYFKKTEYDFFSRPIPIAGKPTIFQIMKDEARWIFQKSVSELTIPKDLGNQFDAHFLGNFDSIAHHSIHSSLEMKEAMMKIDKWLEKTYNYYGGIYSDLHFFVMSDHGQEQITKFLDLEKIIKKTKLKIFKDYLVFYESGFVRFWIRNNKTEKIIRNALSKVKEGRFLSEKDLKKFNVDMPNNDYGDLFFLIKPGNLVFPNYHQKIRSFKNRYKGMHGYCPDEICAKGIFSYRGNKKLKFDEIQIVDIVPSILNIFNYKPPKTMRGKNIWRN